ncbi:MAG: hypothetical protein ACMXX9_02985 [Candidatus Woesearchaeota archaeon]
MARVIITESLKQKIFKNFKKQSTIIFKHLKILENNPHKGKLLTSVNKFLIKEIRYEGFRFYFLTDGKILKFGTQEELANLLIKFVNMSDKKQQQKTIDQIKNMLENLSFDDFK